MKTPMIEASCIAMVQKAIGFELEASHAYMSLANQMQGLGYFGAQKFFAGESREELAHYQRHVDYLNDLGVVAVIPAVTGMVQKVDGLRPAVESALARESDLFQFYKDMTKRLLPEYPELFSHFMEFVDIQRRAVGEYADLLARIDSVTDDRCGLLIIDKEMG